MSLEMLVMRLFWTDVSGAMLWRPSCEPLVQPSDRLASCRGKEKGKGETPLPWGRSYLLVNSVRGRAPRPKEGRLGKPPIPTHAKKASRRAIAADRRDGPCERPHLGIVPRLANWPRCLD